MPALTLSKFLAELVLTAKVYPFGFSLQHYREVTECDTHLLRRKYVLCCFTGLTRALDPIEAVHFRKTYVDKTLPERRIVHPLDAARCIGLPAALADRIIASATQSLGGETRLRSRLLRACGVNFSHALEAANRWRPATTDFIGAQPCPLQSRLSLRR